MLLLQSMTTDAIVDWKKERTPSAEENVEWMSPYDQPIPSLDELEEWERIGKVSLKCCLFFFVALYFAFFDFSEKTSY